MADLADRALLPAGLRDLLPPYAAHEAETAARFMRYFAGFGYEPVSPPLVEFEESLLSGNGAAMAKHTFRVMDPVTQRMMGVRADMTLQVARIATTRLANAERPLRLSYAGQVLRVKGSQLRPERQFGQAGIELIGAPGAAADAEVIAIAGQALTELGVTQASIDLTLPTLVPLILGDAPVHPELRNALDHKDVATVTAIGGAAAPVLCALIAAAGPAIRASAKLAALVLPAAAAAERDRLFEVISLVRDSAPDLTLTVDPVENRGYEYHSGIGFTIFARNVSGELGRGGRYDGGTSTGATLFMDTVLEAVPRPAPARRVFLPVGTPLAAGRKLRQEGWMTLAGLAVALDAKVEARRLGCDHVLIDGHVVSAN